MKKIQELIAQSNDSEEVDVDGFSIPIRSLKKLIEDGYAHLRVYKENRTISLWGKTCSACFTEQQLRERE